MRNALSRTCQLWTNNLIHDSLLHIQRLQSATYKYFIQNLCSSNALLLVHWQYIEPIMCFKPRSSILLTFNCHYPAVTDVAQRHVAYKHISGNNHQKQNTLCFWFDWDSWPSVPLFYDLFIQSTQLWSGLPELHSLLGKNSTQSDWSAHLLQNPCPPDQWATRRCHHWWTAAFGQPIMSNPGDFFYIHTSFPTKLSRQVHFSDLQKVLQFVIKPGN